MKKLLLLILLISNIVVVFAEEKIDCNFELEMTNSDGEFQSFEATHPVSIQEVGHECCALPPFQEDIELGPAIAGIMTTVQTFSVGPKMLYIVLSIREGLGAPDIAQSTFRIPFGDDQKVIFESSLRGSKYILWAQCGKLNE